ncbi:hypothetical protein F511_32229 [Dorcoceras hygrometricum]|uniref:Rubisco LSMT substrate-binding domain-containing protein n=1 Tax=Dorcoceras hygrometricum TaxID=472368 RepID=A0A2Z7CMH8_9LAMI|nr:hypothetical protein F511_32229 [Dorcoceras hygrometricum]
MDCLRNTHCISSPFRPPSLSLVHCSGVSLKARRKCRNTCAASNSETILKSSDITSKKGDEFGDLKSWMHRNGLPPCKVVLKDRPSHDSMHAPIHFVAASEDLQEGDVAFSVPNSLVVTLERVLGNETVAELLTTNKLSELACLALYLMYEKKQGKKSFWYPYIRELDRQRGRGQLAVESPLLWSEAELDYLTGSPTKQYPYDIPTEAFTFEIFKQAFVAVQSCVVHLQKVSLARRFALVPLGPPLLSYRSNCKAMLTAVDGAVQLIVDRPYKSGEPIVVWCGPQPNSKLLINYGFVDEDNSCDRMVIEASLNTEDPQYQGKRLAAQRNGKLSVQNFQVSPCMEYAVLDQLAEYFIKRLAGYPTTLDEDETLVTVNEILDYCNFAFTFVLQFTPSSYCSLQLAI